MYEDEDEDVSREEFDELAEQVARLAKLADEVAVQDEFSHVDSEQRTRIGELVLEGRQDPPEPIEETAQRLVEELDEATLRAILADWLGSQIAI